MRIIGTVSKRPAPLLQVVTDPRGRSRSARHRDVHVLFDDGAWRRATVLGWASDPRRGWLVLLRWPNGIEEWRRYDRRFIHPA